MMPRPHPARCTNGHEFDSYLSKCPKCKSMNVEYEREAFEPIYVKAAQTAYYGVDVAFKDGEYRCISAQRAFNIWMAAKEHAKPLASIKTVDYPTRSTLNIPWYTVEGVCCKCEHQTRESCEEWAVANGYRLE